MWRALAILLIGFVAGRRKHPRRNARPKDLPHNAPADRGNGAPGGAGLPCRVQDTRAANAGGLDAWRFLRNAAPSGAPLAAFCDPAREPGVAARLGPEPSATPEAALPRLPDRTSLRFKAPSRSAPGERGEGSR